MQPTVIQPLTISKDYWDNFSIQESDLQFLYNHLLEIEVPLSIQELVNAMVTNRIQAEKQALKSTKLAGGTIYLPKNQYTLDQKLIFPTLNWQEGHIIAIREGYNPELPPFEVIEVLLANGEKRKFASGLASHVLNQPIEIKLDDPQLDVNFVLNKNGDNLSVQLDKRLQENADLICIAWKWFPRSLLVDINVGYLNMAEALLEMEGGNPLSTEKVLEQIELPTDVNSKLTEFSLNLALKEDGRFDEVGPTGEVLWCLKRLEPEWVQQTPPYLKYYPVAFENHRIDPLLKLLENEVKDELEYRESPDAQNVNEVVISLNFPHWHSGTLPLTESIGNIFPSAYESPRVRFTFIDGDSGQRISGWVVRSSKYAYGLKEWYSSSGLIPGSLVHIIRSKKPGEVIVKAEKRRPTREWIRTALVGADGGVVFAMLKQLISANYDERMTIAIPDVKGIEKIWEQGHRQRAPLEQVVLYMMRELTKLNPQGHVHAQELYAAVNILRRCPPGPILNILDDRPWSHPLGDLYFRLDENLTEGNYL
jgi:hypothetical protein